MAMSDFGDRVRKARKHAKLSQEQLSRDVGIKQGSLSELERFGNSSTYTVQIAQRCAVSADWLATGEGEMIAAKKEASDASQRITGTVTEVTIRAKVPLISWVQAGDFQGVIDVFEPGSADEWIETSESSTSEAAFALRVVGDSMVSPYPNELSFPEGTVLIVDPGRATGPGDYVIAKDVQTQRATFKKLAHDAGRWYLKPLNPAYPTVEIDDPSIRIIGRVVEFQVRGKL